MLAVAAFLLAVVAAEPVQVPRDPGLYYLSSSELLKIEGRPVTLARSGGKISSGVTLGIRDRKINAAILGRHAQQRVISSPVFYYRAAPDSEATGAGAADLVLVKLKRKSRHRQFEISTEDDWKSTAGVPLRSQVEFYKKQVESGVVKLIPAHDLEPGEYGFFLFRGRDLPGLIYDFWVE